MVTQYILKQTLTLHGLPYQQMFGVQSMERYFSHLVMVYMNGRLNIVFFNFEVECF